MTGWHPDPSDLLALDSPWGASARSARLSAHVSECGTCRETLAALADVERAIGGLPDASPPEEGLARVLERVRGSRPGRIARASLAPLVAGAVGVGAAVLLIACLGLRLLQLPPLAGLPLLAPLRTASGMGLAALAFFALGSFVTLALAPVLLIESQRRPVAVR
jgi:hypothetical protein